MLRPSTSLSLKLLVSLALLALLSALFLVLRVPWFGLELRPDYTLGQVLLIDAPASLPDGLTPPIFLVALIPAAGDPIPIELDDMVEEPDLLGDNARIARFLARQDQLYGALQSERIGVLIQGADNRQAILELTAATRPFFSLPLAFWVQAVVALASFLTGCWIWLLRQQDWGARCFFVSGAGILLAAMTAAIYSSRELALDGALFRALSAINFAGAALFGVAMIGLFLSYPRQLLSPRWMLVLTGLLYASALWHILERYEVVEYLAPDTYFPPQLIMLEMSGIILCVVAQWFATRGDPASRAVLRWLGMSIVVCSGLFVVLFYVPVILGEPLVISQGYSFVFFLLIYIGIALGLRRYRLFDLGTWAFRIMFYLSALLGFILLDALIISMLQIGADISTGIALLVIGFGYLPLRDWLWRLSLGRSRSVEQAHLMEALDIPFSTDASQANTKWERLLGDVFDPLQVLPARDSVRSPTLRGEGVELVLPATASVSALSLRYCQGGKRLFSSTDLQFARQLMKLLEQAEKSRDAYEQGRRQERERIAQDLHDDIGARLLSSLHSDDLGSARSNIRKTIADLRAVVGGLVGTQVPLTELISTLRYEAGNRLEEAGMELDWPLDGPEETGVLVDYRFSKNLGSILRECVSNVMVHARATRVAIVARVERDTLRLRFADDGVGPGNSRTQGSGNGLRNIRDRVAALNGSLILSDEGLGFVLELSLPLPLVQQSVMR